MPFECLKNCGICCGCVKIPKTIYEKNKHKIQSNVIKEFDFDTHIHPITKDMLCPFLNRKTKSCEIYEDRPNICKHFGEKIDLPCPYLDHKGNQRQTKEIKKIKEHHLKTALFTFSKISSNNKCTQKQ